MPGKTVKTEAMATRDAYGKTLVELGRENKNIVVLDADLSSSTRTCVFGEEFPERFFNVGIAEQNMMGLAAGLATCGKIPFVSTFAVFASGRVYNQVRQCIAYTNLNVKIVATHGGISVGEDGPSHQCTEDVAVMRALPNMTVIVPSDAIETGKAVRATAEQVGPVYMRLGRPKVPVIYDEKIDFEIGKAILLKDGEDLAILGTGIMVAKALEAASLLSEEGVNARVIDVHTIKPIDQDIIVKAAKDTGAVVTAEEHSIIGGLGSAVAEVLVESYPVPMLRVGVKDEFAESASAEELLIRYGLTTSDIFHAAKKALEKKK